MRYGGKKMDSKRPAKCESDSRAKGFLPLSIGTHNLPLEIRQELDIAQKKCMKAGNYAETPYEWPYNHVCDDFLAGHGCTFQGPDFGTFSRQGGADNYVADPNSNKRNYRAIWYRRQLAAHYLLVQVPHGGYRMTGTDGKAGRGGDGEMTWTRN
ncbi:hypothetical protein MSG28_004043 [Choristoneura fumiferana]|uniref:Uncharacterized protein n=1 Tax=Choristoneura fumiferana TaxID=7141 RepID=A0ACC0KID0_CHOFU|nr:hypothetical protein MSG28_004043 [Choristoneura fumiferana]